MLVEPPLVAVQMQLTQAEVVLVALVVLVGMVVLQIFFRDQVAEVAVVQPQLAGMDLVVPLAALEECLVVALVEMELFLLDQTLKVALQAQHIQQLQEEQQVLVAVVVAVIMVLTPWEEMVAFTEAVAGQLQA